MHSEASSHNVVICCAHISNRKALKTAKYLVFPEGLRHREKKERICGPRKIVGTLSHEESSFDLIIWNGQSAFVDEESLWYLGVKKSMSRTKLWLIDCGRCTDNICHGQLFERIRQNSALRKVFPLCVQQIQHSVVPLLLTLLALEWLIITCSKVCIYVCFFFIFADSHTHFLRMDGQRMKSYAYFEVVFIAWKRARHLYHSKGDALIIGPRRCLSKQPFPGILLETSTAGNWIHLAVGVQPPLTDAHTAEILKWQMFPRLLKPECSAMTSRYRLSDAVWAVWQSSGLFKSVSEQMGRGDWRWRKAWGCLFVGVSSEKHKRLTFSNNFGFILTYAVLKEVRLTLYPHITVHHNDAAKAVITCHSWRLSKTLLWSRFNWI